MIGVHANKNKTTINVYSDITILLLQLFKEMLININEIDNIVKNVIIELGLYINARSISPWATQIHPLVSPQEAQGTP